MRKVHVGRQVFEVKTPVILGEETGPRFPCCGKGACLHTEAAAQHVECSACGFPWLVRRKGKGFDWSPDHSGMGRALPPGVSQQDMEALVGSFVAGTRPKGQVTKTGARRRGAGRDGPTQAGVKVKWITWRAKPPDNLGHGVGFYDVQIEGQYKSLVAFLEGFAWLHGISTEAVIHCIRPNLITTARVLAAMKKRIEEILGRRELPNNRITRRIFAFVNG